MKSCFKDFWDVYPYSCYDLLNGLIKCPFVIHTYFMLCNGHTELKKVKVSDICK